jgi:hypothetical protein
VSLPFFLIHCLLAHKELRFLFPLVPIAPFLGFLALEGSPKVTRRLFSGSVPCVAWGILAVLNAVGLVVRAVAPAHEIVAIQRAIYQSLPQRLLIVDGKDPCAFAGLHSYFYRDPTLQTANLTDAGGEIIAGALRTPALVALLWPASLDTSRLSCVVLHWTLPAWAQREPVWSWLQWARPRPWTLARCVEKVVVSSSPGLDFRPLRTHLEASPSRETLATPSGPHSTTPPPQRSSRPRSLGRRCVYQSPPNSGQRSRPRSPALGAGLEPGRVLHFGQFGPSPGFDAHAAETAVQPLPGATGGDPPV